MRIDCICEFINSISYYSVQHLGWVTAIVAAILALTSIVFSQFNERSIQKANDISREIKNMINKNDGSKNNHMIKEDFNQMTYLLLNSFIYKRTLFLFQSLSYFIVFLWWFSLIGYINHADNIADKVLIVLSTILLTIPFIYLPDIMKMFNKNQPLKFDKKDQLDVKEVIRFFKENTSLSKNRVISDFLNPKISIEIRNRKIIIHNTIDIEAVNFTTIFIIQNDERRIIFNTFKETGNRKEVFSLIPLNYIGDSHDDGLFKLFRSSIDSEASIFFCISETEYISYKGEVKYNEGKIEVSILNDNNKTLDRSDYHNKNNLIVQPDLGEPKGYKLQNHSEKL